jgi:hypothetical protein
LPVPRGCDDDADHGAITSIVLRRRPRASTFLVAEEQKRFMVSFAKGNDCEVHEYFRDLPPIPIMTGKTSI